MNEEDQRFIEELTAAGASEQEIVEILDKRAASRPAVTPQTPQSPKPGNALDYPELGAESLVQSFTSLPMKAVGAIDETLNRYVYNPLGIGAGKNYTSPATAAGQKVADFYTADVPAETRNSLGGQISSGLGTGVAMLMTGGASSTMKGAQAVSTLPTLGKTVAGAFVNPVAGLGGAMTSIPEYEAAKAAGLPEDELFGVLFKNYLVGQTEAVPIMNMGRRLNNLTGGTIFKKIQQVGMSSGVGAIEEGVQEGIQTYLSNQIAKDTYDPDRDPFWGLANAMTVGGIVGAILPGVGAAISSAPADVKPKLEKKLAEIQMLEKAVKTANEALSDGQIGGGIDEEIDQASQVKEDVVENVQEQHEASLAIEKAEDDQKHEENLIKEAEKNEPSESVPATGKGGDTAASEGVAEESEAYKAANEAYQLELTKLKASPNVEVGPKGFTPLNDAGVEEVRTFTQAWQTRDNARIADLKTPVKREKATIKMTPGAALKHQVQTFYRGVEKGTKKGAALKGELLTKVQDAIKEYPLSPKQVSTILTRVKNTNLFTPGSVSRLNDYISKVADDATVADKYEQAYSIRKKIKGKRSSEGLSWQEKQALKKFSAVDPDYVDIDAYLAQAQTVSDTLLRPVKERTALDIGSIDTYLANTPDTNLLKEAERAEKAADNLGVSFEVAQMLLQEDAEPAEDKKAKLTAELVEIAEQAKNEVYDKWESGDLEGATETQRIDIEGLKRIDTGLLSPSQLRDYIRTVDRVVTNEDFGGAGKFSALAKAQEDFSELLKIGKNWNILNLNALEVLGDSVPMSVQAIVGLPKDAALFQLYMGLKGVSDASVKSLDAEADLVTQLNSLKKKHKKGFEDDSILRQGIYGELIRYTEDADPSEALKQNKEAIEQSIENHKKMGASKEAADLAKLYEPFKDEVTIEGVQSVMRKVDPAGAAVMDKAIEFFSQYADKVADYNSRYYNEPTTKVINYSGPRVWRKSGTGLEAQDYAGELNLDKGVPLDYTLARPKQTSSAKAVNNQTRPDAVLDLNKHINMANGVKKTIFDLESVASLLQLVENSKRPELPQIFGAKEGDDKSIKKADELKNKLFGKDGVATDFLAHAANKKIPDSFEKAITKILNPLRKFGYTLSLSGVSQVPKQMTVLANTAINLGGDLDLLTGSLRDLASKRDEMREFLKGETVSMRGAQKSQFSLGEIVSEDRVSGIEKGIDSMIQFGFEGWAGIRPLVETDAAVAKATYLAFYKQYLRDNGVEYKGLKEESALRNEKERQEARAYAKHRTDISQVVSNPNELGKKIKDQGFGWQIAKALLVPYGTFSANTKARMWADWRAVVSGSSAQRKAGAQDLAATMVEQVVFQSVSAALKVYVWSLLGQAVVGLFDVPDDRDREDRTWESAVKTWQTNLFFDLLPILLTDPGEKAVVPLINDAARRALNYKKKDKDLLYKYSAPKDDPVQALTEHMGPYGVPIEKMQRLGQLSADMVTGTKDVQGRERKLTPEQRRLLAADLMLFSLHMGGLFPADFMNTIDKEYKNQKPGRKNVSSNP